jgi:hypothetical protein
MVAVLALVALLLAVVFAIALTNVFPLTAVTTATFALLVRWLVLVAKPFLFLLLDLLFVRRLTSATRTVVIPQLTTVLVRVLRLPSPFNNRLLVLPTPVIQ